MFCTVKSVCVADVCGDLKSTSNQGRSSVAAGCTAMSQLSSLFVVVGLIVDVPANADVASIDARRTAENRIANDLPPDHYVNRLGSVAVFRDSGSARGQLARPSTVPAPASSRCR